jgi:hypothetical protein
VARDTQTSSVPLRELDGHIEWLASAITQFGNKSSDALDSAAAHREFSHDDLDFDVLPREEVFLISNFIMNMRHGAYVYLTLEILRRKILKWIRTHTMEMLKHSRKLLELRESRKARRRLHFPKFKMRKWLFSGSEETDTIRVAERHTFIRDERDESKEATENSPIKNHNTFRAGIKYRWRRFRQLLGYFLDWVSKSDNFIYAFKFSLGVMILSWPAFVPAWVEWYKLSRGGIVHIFVELCSPLIDYFIVWAPIIFVLVFENAVGSTIWIFALRTVGTVVGSTIGYAAYESRHGNEFTMAVIIMVAIIPCYYVQLGTRYQKAGMVCTISMCVVALSTHLQTVPSIFASEM